MSVRTSRYNQVISALPSYLMQKHRTFLRQGTCCFTRLELTCELCPRIERLVCIPVTLRVPADFTFTDLALLCFTA